MAVANALVMLGLLPEPRAEAILAEHREALERGGFGNAWGVTEGELTVRPGAHGYWEARAAGLPETQRLAAAAGVRTGTGEPPWPTPAECYLAALAPATSVSIATSDRVAEAGPEETAEIVAKVADRLMAVGALPVTSMLLRESSSGAPAWQAALAHRWGRRAHRRAGSRPVQRRALETRLLLAHATAVIESVAADGELVSIQLYGHPWVMGEYWPMITPCFQVRATDDAGNEHEGMAWDWQGFPRYAGCGSFWFWPPIDPARQSIQVTVSTLWEAAWAEFDLPR